MPELRIGCSGFTYNDWAGAFYPEKLPRAKWFEHYCSLFSTVELNVTFYRLPRPSTFDTWYRESPPDFGFSLKGSRFITHVKKLVDPQESIARFFDGALRLKDKLKVVLWQFPPGFEINRDRLTIFLALLKNYTTRHTLEFRHESWIATPVIELCREQNVGLCMADWPAFADDLPVTSDFVYIRRHGKGGNYASCYSPGDLKKDASRIERYLRDRKDVFMYFNNDFRGYAPRNARELMAFLG